jgi:hypothetical protein
MDTDTLIWIIVAAVIVLLLLGLAAVMVSRKKKEQRKAQAAELREDAVARSPRVDEADARARAARTEAERAEAKAREAEQARTVEQAEFEDRIREADRLDPAVDTKSDDYEPEVRYPAEPGSTPPPPSPGAHRGTEPEAGRGT